MLTKDFYFDLPEELIAQHPSTIRGQDKLMVLNRTTGQVSHCQMADLVDLVDPGTLMIFNNSKVRRSRCYAQKQGKELPNNRPIEFMILQEELSLGGWKVMVKNAKKQRVGDSYTFSDGTQGIILENPEYVGTEFRTMQFDRQLDENWFERNGHIPLPPYIKREDTEEDSTRYQNVYAKETGSAACPTAGLHFTPELMEKLASKGVQIGYVTLHVGLGTFLPVRSEKIEEHTMHEEIYSVSSETAELVCQAKKEGRKILAVGTTSVRTLESAWVEGQEKILTGIHSTSIFLYPGKKFHVVDQLFTNFHTPESTLLMLVSAFAGKEHIFAAYKQGVENKYRFFSYGDAMFIK